MISKSVMGVFIILVVLAGCASGPSTDTPPDWVLQRPGDDDSYFYFTGSGVSPAGDLNEARSTATGEILAEIMRYIGVKVTSETTAVAKGSLDDFQANVEQTVRQGGTARVVGLEFQDSWADNRGAPQVTMHILVRYQRSELLKEKQRIEALFRERIEAVAGPEREGDGLADDGRHYEAAIQYITAAAATLQPDIDNADVKFKRNIDKAMAAVEKIALIKINDNLSGVAGEPLAEPLMLKVVAGATQSDPGIPAATIRVSYHDVHPSTGRNRVRSTTIKTDGEGVATFVHPAPTFVGEAAVTMSLDMTEYTDLLMDAPRTQRPQVDGLEGLILSKRATYRVVVESMAAKIATGLLILDYNLDGSLAGLRDSSATLQTALSGYNLRVLSFRNTELAGMTLDDVVALVKSRYGGQVKRLLIGQTRILEFSARSGRTFAKAQAEASVIDLSNGEILLTSSKQKSGMGNAEQDAQVKAFRGVGQELGNDIKNRLK